MNKDKEVTLEQLIWGKVKEWSQKTWPTINRRRGELIFKSIGYTATREELEELDMLNDYADFYLDTFSPIPTDMLEKLSQLEVTFID